MTVFPLLAVGFIMKVVMVFYVICALSLILIILVQKGKGGGLSGAFGGGMASGILGSKTGDFLTWVTIVLVHNNGNRILPAGGRAKQEPCRMRS
jgi:preprotein translocase subunit SecG